MSALIAACVALIVAYTVNFVAEDFRRFRDGATVAAALAGELSSHALALPQIRVNLNRWIELARKEMRVSDRLFDFPTDPVFDAYIDKLGLLDSQMVEDIVFVYQQIRFFRVGFRIILEHQEMPFDELIARCSVLLQTVDRANGRGELLLLNLKSRATERYGIKWSRLP